MALVMPRPLRAIALSAALLAAAPPGCAPPGEVGALVPPTADDDPSLPQIRLEIAGRSRAVHVETYGEASSPPLLVLHGSYGDFRALRPFRALADRYLVVLWDQRGNGLSERITAAEYTLDSIVDEIDAVRERFAPGRPATLLGHSFGGMYAALYTTRRPELVAELALLEPGPLNGTIFNDTYADVINVDLFDHGFSEMQWQNELLSPSSHEALDYRALMVLLNGRQTNYFCDPDRPPYYPVWRPGAYVESLRGGLIASGGGLGAPRFDFDFAEGLAEWPGRAVIVAGSCSAIGPDFQRRSHAPLFADVEIVAVEGAGHRLFVEKFDEVLGALRSRLGAYRSDGAPP